MRVLNLESVVKVYGNDPGTPDATINFDDMDLLAVATLGMDSAPSTSPMNLWATFDALMFNQNVYVTHFNDHGDAAPVNFYLELEQFTISKLRKCYTNSKKYAERGLVHSVRS